MNNVEPRASTADLDMLLEREEHLATLESRSDDARRGLGSTLLIAGDAGEGKTTLLRHFGRHVKSGVLVLASRCDPLSTPSPMAPFREVAQPLGLADTSPTAADDRGALFAAILEALAERGPSIWIIEDVHWADGVTLDLIRYLSRRIDDHPALLVLSYRSDEIGDNHPFHAVLAEILRTPSGHRIELPPLSITAVADIVGPDAAERVHDVTGGNAFFVTEIAAAHDTDGVPDSVRDAVLERVSRLSPTERRLAELVSVASRSLPYDAPHALAETPDEVIESTLRSGVLVETAAGLAYRHDLARRAVESSIRTPTRRRLHRDLLQYWAAHHPHDLSVLAHHARRSGEPDAVVEFCPPAARQAHAAGALREAEQLARAALDHRDQLPASVVVEMLAMAVSSLIVTADAESARPLVRDLLDVANSSDDSAFQARAWIVAARHRYYSSDPSGARTAADRAVRAAERVGDDTMLAEMLIQRASFAMLAREREAPLSDLDRAIELLGNDVSWHRARALNILGSVHLGTGDPDVGLRLLEESLQIGESMGDMSLTSNALANLGSGSGEVRRYDAAIGWLTRACDFSRGRDLDNSASYERAWLVRVHVERGEWDLATEIADREASGGQAPIAVATLGCALGRLAVRRGDSDAAAQLGSTMERVGDVDLQHRWVGRCAEAELAWLERRPDEGREILRPSYEDALATKSPWAKGETRFWMWMCGEDVERPADLATPFDLHVAGDWKGAATEWQRIGSPYEEALARSDGTALDKLAALAIFDRLGARPAAAWLRRQLRTDGIESVPRGPRAATRENPHGLTPRQVEVLELAAEGLTNGEIADRLHLSGKTVEHHMSAILGKLGVSNRREAIDVVDAT